MSEKEEKLSPFARPAFVLSSVFMGALLVGAAYLGASGALSNNSAHVDRPVSLASAPGGIDGIGGTGSNATSGSVCPESPVSSESGALPAIVEHRVREGLTLPVVEGVGAMVRDEELVRCWAHSPQGALLAGASVVTQLFKQENPVAVVTQYVEDTPVRQALLSRPVPAVEPKPQILILGYRYKHIEPDFVSVELAIGAHWMADTPISVTADMAWNDQAQDWKLVLNESGWGMTHLGHDIVAAGFTQWAGQ